jgi:hypothetical protein
MSGAYRGLSRRLLDKSIEAFVLSLETINRLSIKYRIENFLYLICNAWELLLKAKLLHDTGKRSAISYPKRRGERPRTLALRDCLLRLFTTEADPVRLNVEHVANLRDESVHLVISHVPRDIMGLFQACVLNYHQHLGAWAGVSLSDRVTVGMMTIVYDFSPEEDDLQNATMRKRLGRDAVEYLTQVQAALRADALRLGHPAAFSIDIQYRLALTKNPSQADITLTAGPAGGTITQVVEVPKDPCKTHPLRLKEVISALGAKTDMKINTYDLRCIIEIHGIRKRAEFYYQGTIKGSPVQYSHEFIGWITKQYQNDHDFFFKARNAFGQKAVVPTKAPGTAKANALAKSPQALPTNTPSLPAAQKSA